MYDILNIYKRFPYMLFVKGGSIMQSSGLKSMVNYIFSNGKARSEFQTNPEKVMAEFDLSDNERKAILASHAKLGLVSGGSATLASEIGALDSWI
jgi:hypothetical protein